ncbi:ShlB/FhaC/HecB family hemolysin secretion/activation protein [Sphingomonas radiodurans]|uniref:ShlB/FhaC/HecB family hemolysin secretion/activation protein n=1 Tax=Sphingomonas radiodurans TaxID=2890321 RepID=UPI001E35294F|nr:ShlB/FhaC/HecB family hemolysin secretion/activation protein [Sphingomonas radiodurans]WBH15017.1 hypothetical protein LLW23_09045 [Sphingomonas radiodurans]
MRAAKRALAALLICLAAPTAAQVVERHLPPAPVTSAPRLAEPALPAEADDRPLGPRLTGIILLGPKAPAASGTGIRVVGVAPPRQVALVRTLATLLGRPVSRKLLADAIAIVTRGYRRAERPFVSVTTPPQNLTAGVLQLRVVEFAAGKLVAQARTEATAAVAASHVRFLPGERIDARRLRQDLGWIDRYPFRRVGALFSPGIEPGTTDLTLNVVSTRPWQAFTGIASSDAPSSGNMRVLAGIVLGDLFGSGSLLSVQGTTSGFDHPRYWSVAGRMTMPLGARREVSVLVGHVRGRAALAPFASTSETTEAALGVRFALPPALLGDAHLGIEAGRQRVGAQFGGLPVYDVEATTFAATAGYRVVLPISSGVLSADIAVHASPGGIGRANEADRLFFGRARAGSATYAYLTADIAIERTVAAILNWRGRALVQASAATLPGLDQIGIGGSAYARGYTLDDGGYDSAIVVRNSLGPRQWKIAAYAFTDWSYARDRAARRTVAIGSAGLGFDQAIGSRIRFVAEAALPLLNGPRTMAMHPRLVVRADLTF